jgi:hypothetical protein
MSRYIYISEEYYESEGVSIFNGTTSRSQQPTHVKRNDWFGRRILELLISLEQLLHMYSLQSEISVDDLV